MRDSDVVKLSIGKRTIKKEYWLKEKFLKGIPNWNVRNETNDDALSTT